jgi:hypothetical protein
VKPELAILQLLAARGVPVPVIEAADPDGAQTGIPCALIRDVRMPRTDSQLHRTRDPSHAWPQPQ